MKRNKLIALLLAVLLCLSIPTVASADGEGPHFSELEGTVEKENGIPLYKYLNDETEDTWELKPSGITIPKGTALTLRGEFDEDGVLFFSLEYQEEYGYVRKDDVHLELTEVAPVDENAYASPRHYVVIAQEGAQVRKGPGRSYEVVKTLSKGKEITVTHADDLSPDDGYSIWDYTPDARGWVQTGNDRDEEPVFAKSVKYRESVQTPRGTAKVLNEAALYKTIDDTWNYEDEEPAEPLIRIPAGEELQFELYSGEYAYVTYKGKTGWLPLWNNVEAPVDGYLLVVDTKPLYKDAAVNENTGTGKKLESFQIVPYDLRVEKSIVEGLEPYEDDFYNESYDTWFRVTVDGAQYWVKFNTETDKDYQTFYSAGWFKVAETSNFLLFEAPDTASRRIGKIPGGAEFAELFDYIIPEHDAPEATEEEREWHYVVYGDLSGWTYYSYEKVEWGNQDLVYSLESFLKDPKDNDIVNRMKQTATASDETEPADTKKDQELQTTKQAEDPGVAVKASPRAIILGCVAAAGILALVAAITILLVRKKKTAGTQPPGE